MRPDEELRLASSIGEMFTEIEILIAKGYARKQLRMMGPNMRSFPRARLGKFEVVASV